MPAVGGPWLRAAASANDAQDGAVARIKRIVPDGNQPAMEDPAGAGEVDETVFEEKIIPLL